MTEHVADTPAWATLEVAAGGFTTGKLAAGGPLRPHELALLDALGLAHDDHARAALNAHHLGAEGLAELRRRIRDGTYRLEVPEEAALLVVAWLTEHGDAGDARAILDAIEPYLGRLRFYPAPHAEGELEDELVHLQPVAVTARELDAMREDERFLAEREAIQVWAPFVDQLVELVAETEADGWPCQHYPDGWKARALATVFAIDARRVAPHRCRDVDRPRSNLARLAQLVEHAAHDPLGLTGRDVGELRGLLARIELRRGQPGSPRLLALRAGQGARAARPTRRELAREVSARLRARPGDRGLDADEVDRAPEALRAIVRRSLDATPEALVDALVIGSAEALARVVPQLTAPVIAAGVRDPDLRRLHGALDRAFRRRRALLRPWLRDQVTLDDLPWARTGVETAATQLAARAALRRIVELAVVRWPHAILPGALLRELRALVARADLALPIVGDRLTGDVTRALVDSARRAARRLEGTLYATYYGVPCDVIARIDEAGLVALCEARAGVELVEQLEILTTRDLAPLIGALGMTPRLAAALPALARACFTEVVRRIQLRTPRAIQDAAHAWRQMILFLSLAPRGGVDGFLMWAGGEVAKLTPEVRVRFGPAYAGLCLAAAGMTPGDATAPAARPLLGSGDHWLR